MVHEERRMDLSFCAEPPGDARGWASAVCPTERDVTKRLRRPASSLSDMARDKDRPRTEDNSDFLATPMYRLVDRHRPILEKIRTREDAEYWGHMLIGEWYPEVPSSRAASGKLAALGGLTDYLDF